ncbi:MAG: NAD(P)/FAD-dependent oxidoreductase [Pseudomonadota bacterium]|nr:NAD(P)/FAD-dependent oxidoreductase [Pseudomonadota bacterium]
MDRFNVIVIGAGAAGLMCAMTAARRGRRVLLLDHADRVGAKILISGGGRCNFTNRFTAPDRFLSSNPPFCISALQGYTAQDFIALVEKHKIAYHEKTLGQLFCDVSARQIVDMLVAECAAAHVDVRLRHSIGHIAKGEAFRVETDQGAFTADALVLATGGLSIPKLGATGFTHKVARQFGLPVTALRPGLVPLTFEGDDLAFMQPLSGVSLPVVASCGKGSFTEEMIFTHRGLSGPAILQISSWWRESEAITLDCLPGLDAKALLRERKKARPKAELKTILAEVMPQRLASQFAALQHPGQPIVAMTDKKLDLVAGGLKAWQLFPSGSEGYAKAEVTLGGVDTAALSSKTMESRSVKNLYVIGEAVDVTGWLGGYNFQWAWSSGWSAGMAV